MQEANALRPRERSLTHRWIWNAIDTLAARNGLTPSGLARSAGLDPTTFNRSKRVTPEGRPRWPSTESIAKVLEATETTLDAFATLQLQRPLEFSVDGIERGEIAGVEVVAEIRDGAVVGWDPIRSGAPVANRDPIVTPIRRRFASHVGDTSLEPAYSPGNLLVVSEASPPRPGDRVLVKLRGALVVPRLLLATGETHITLASCTDGAQSLRVEHHNVGWIARIVLVRQ
jgi:phage repressor protein C with HTH and peptisase S24 domain